MMSFLTQIIKNLRLPLIQRCNFHSLAVASAPKFNETTIIKSEWSLLPARTNIRNHFPKPKEVKRIKVHGWEKRMSTLEGRRVLMRRILKGRHVLSH